LRSYSGATFATVKRSANEFYETLVVDVPSRSYDEIAVRKLASVKTDGGFVIEGRHSVSRAFNRATERLIRKIGSVEKFAEELIGRVLDHFHLFEDYLLFAFEVFLVKTRVRNEIRQ
jgi:dihydroneopterin aldolase